MTMAMLFVCSGSSVISANDMSFSRRPQQRNLPGYWVNVWLLTTRTDVFIVIDIGSRWIIAFCNDNGNANGNDAIVVYNLLLHWHAMIMLMLYIIVFIRTGRLIKIKYYVKTALVFITDLYDRIALCDLGSMLNWIECLYFAQICTW